MYKVDKNIILETDRLILRYIDINDDEDIYLNIVSSDNVLKYYVTRKVESIDETRNRIKNWIEHYYSSNMYFFSIVLKETNEVIGIIHQVEAPNNVFNSTEIGYAIGEKYWNNGYTTEALKKMIDFMFSLGVHKVFASYLEPNIQSKKVMIKSGMVYEGERIDEIYYHDNYYKTIYYYILNKENR